MENVSVLKFAEARASEIAALMKDIDFKKKKTAFQNLPPHMRRRAASHNPRRVPRKLREAYLVQNPHAASKPKKAPRNVRKFKQKKKHEKQAKNYPEEYASRSRSDGIWLETHIWHAKRCKMEHLWGYKLPIQCNDKKLGATHQAATKHVMLQDLSYYGCIELKGPENKLLDQLNCLVDPDTGSQFCSEMYIHGDIEGHTFLYQPDKFPYEGIGPVTFIWKAILQDSADHSSSDILRKLWIWCHPALYEELVDILIKIFQLEKIAMNDKSNENSDGNIKTAFASKVNFEKTRQHFNRNVKYANDNLEMFLLKDKLIRFRLVGPNALSVLTKVLEIAEVNGDNDLQNSDDKSVQNAKDVSKPEKRKIDSESENCNVSKKRKVEASDTDEINENVCVIQEAPVKKLELNKQDVKEESVESTVAECIASKWWKSHSKSELVKTHQKKRKNLLEYLQNGRASYYINPSTVIGLTVRDPRVILNVDKRRFTAAKDFSDMNEILDAEISDSPIWDENIRDEVTKTQIPENEINQERAKYAIPSESLNMGDKESRVPLLLVHQPGTNGFCSGWDLIAPLGWGMAFWIPLVLNGARVAGLRDLHFVNMETGRPSFPISYPDTEACSKFEEKQRVDELTTHFRRPKAKRPNFTAFGIPNPFFMPWKILVDDWLKELTKDKNVFFPTEYNSFDESISFKLNDSKREFFVQRQKEIRKLQNVCELLCRLKPGRPVAQCRINDIKEMFVSALKCIITTQKEFSSLVLIRLKSLTRGVPSVHSGIYALDSDDIKEIKSKPNFLGSMEPNHNEPKPKRDNVMDVERPDLLDYNNLVDKSTSLENIKKSHSGTQLPTEVSTSSSTENNKTSHTETQPSTDATTSSTENIKTSCTDTQPSAKDSTSSLTEAQSSAKTSQGISKDYKIKNQIDPIDLEKPSIKSLINISSRKMVGYLSEGGFASIMGKGCGIGHCSFIALLYVLKNCIDAQIPPYVLVREQHSFQYRISVLEIIPNYL